MKQRMVMLVMLGSLVPAAATGAQEPGWSGVVIARGDQRRAIEATDILQRPYRPLHFYGNTIRRQYYRGRPYPTVRDLTRGAAAWAFRR
jgi:hypothetical protein